jgi:hypothetical protein
MATGFFDGAGSAPKLPAETSGEQANCAAIEMHAPARANSFQPPTRLFPSNVELTSYDHSTTRDNPAIFIDEILLLVCSDFRLQRLSFCPAFLTVVFNSVETAPAQQFLRFRPEVP